MCVHFRTCSRISSIASLYSCVSGSSSVDSGDVGGDSGADLWLFEDCVDRVGVVAVD